MSKMNPSPNIDLPVTTPPDNPGTPVVPAVAPPIIKPETAHDSGNCATTVKSGKSGDA